MQTPRLLSVWCGVLAVAVGAGGETFDHVTDVRPLSESVQTDGVGDLGFSTATDGAQQPVKRMWGVSDATARAGRLFEHTIDKSAFQGPVHLFEVFGRTTDAPLPSWLTFDAGRRTFSGVPLLSELGPHLVTVRALAKQNSSSAKDRFMIDVVHEPEGEHDHLLLDGDVPGEPMVCADGSATTVASVYFDVEPQYLDGATRLRLLRTFADVVHVPADVLHVTSHSGPLPMGDANVLEAGPGAAERHSHHLTVLSWKVGCSDQVHPERRDGLQVIQQDRRLSSLSATTGQTAVAWLVYSKQTTGRRRRQVEGDGSGDDEYGWEDYDGGFYDWDDYDDMEPVTHVIPTLASPTADGPPSSPAYPLPRVTATVNRARMTTVIPVPVVPTRYLPDSGLQPSRTMDEGLVSPTLEHTHLESSMRLPGRPEATAHWPDLISATPTMAGPHVVETAAVGSSNYPPHLQRRLRKLLVIAGKELRFTVPESTFQDQESGGTRQLHLVLRKDNGAPLLDSDWLQFDAIKQEVYGLPKEEHIGEYRFLLTAQDEQGASVTESLDVSVRQYQQWRAINHRFYLHFNLLKPRHMPVTVDWQLLLLRKLAAMQGQQGTAGILVYGMRVIQDQPVRLVWVNDTLSTHSCDTRQLSRIAAHVLGKEGAPSAELRKVLSPEFHAVSVGLELTNVCRGEELDAVPQQTVTVTPKQNEVPIRRKPIDLISATVGRLLKLQVPEETFFDVEDGSVREMELRLLTDDRQPVPEENWLRFEPRNQEFIGLPLDQDVGLKHYHLECIDSGGKKRSDSIEVVVQARDPAAPEPAVEFSVTLEEEYDQFSRDPLQKARLMQKLAALFGDNDTDAMLVQDIQQGSVIFSWHNQSLPTDRCADSVIDALRRRLVDASGEVTNSAVRALAPDFRLRSAEVTERGVCLAPRTPTVPPRPPPDDAQAVDEQVPPGKGDEYLVTFIIPAVVIAAMLLIAGVIACVLYRARRRGKMTRTDNGTYVSRGIPVIFSDELEDRMEKNAKTPVILTNEQPPEPPMYPASVDGASSPATPMLNARGEAAGEDTPYERPPPLTGVADDRSGRAKPVPNYRQPPPYVPP